MQQALPCRSWLSTSLVDSSIIPPEPIFKAHTRKEEASNVKNMVSENAVILIGKRGCCMCHAMKRLLLMLGVNPAVYEVDDKDEDSVVSELFTTNLQVGKGDKPEFPSVFIGGRLFGGLDRLMAAHISGELKPMLKQAGALWL